MKLLLWVAVLVLVSQHALAVVVEVYEGEKSVLLPCQYTGFIPEDNPKVMWSTPNDLNPKSVHVRQEDNDDPKGQNQRYRGRTSMRPDALDSQDFSLTLRKPTVTDSGNYTCSISDGREDLELTGVQLHVKDQQVEVEVEEGSESVILPCKTKPELREDTRVKWTRSDRELMMVHGCSNVSDHLKKQDDLYCGRTTMNEDLLRTGDLSLTLKYPTERDTGEFICTIYRDKDILRQKVVLQVKERFPSWAIVLLVFLVLVLLVSGGLLFNFRHYLVSVYPVKVKVEEGAESVQLPFKTTKNLPDDVQVLWDRYEPFQNAHVYQNRSDRPHRQHQDYRGRTRINEDPLRTGDLSLTLMFPTGRDSGEYKCLVWKKGNFIRKKKVLLTVKVCAVEGAESVQLPFRTSENLPEDARVEWKREKPKPSVMVHMYPNGSDQPGEQHQDYRDRTRMNEDPLRTGDLSLTLKHPTERDSGGYRCLVWSNGNFIRKKKMLLTVKGRVQVQDQTGDIRNRSSSIDPTPLTAHRSV